jgi:hypothetical protein
VPDGRRPSVRFPAELAGDRGAAFGSPPGVMRPLKEEVPSARRDLGPVLTLTTPDSNGGRWRSDGIATSLRRYTPHETRGSSTVEQVWSMKGTVAQAGRRTRGSLDGDGNPWIAQRSPARVRCVATAAATVVRWSRRRAGRATGARPRSRSASSAGADGCFRGRRRAVRSTPRRSPAAPGPTVACPATPGGAGLVRDRRHAACVASGDATALRRSSTATGRRTSRRCDGPGADRPAGNLAPTTAVAVTAPELCGWEDAVAASGTDASPPSTRAHGRRRRGPSLLGDSSVALAW